MGDAQLAADVAPESGGELGAAVRCQAARDTEAGDPGGDEDIGAGGGVHTLEWDRFQPAAGPVHHGEKVFEPFRGGGKRAHQVHMDVREAL